MSVNSIPSVRCEIEGLRSVNAILLDTFSQCNKMKADILEYSQNPRNDLRDFKETLADIAQLQKDTVALIQTLETVEPEVVKEEDLEEMNFEIVSDIFRKVHSSSLEETYVNDEVEKIISAVDAYINDQDSVFNKSNGDLLVTATKESYLDPLTKLLIQDPVKSKTCHHAFERSSIMKHLRKYKRCPYSGCVNNLNREDLVEDLALKRKLLRMNRSQKK